MMEKKIIIYKYHHCEHNWFEDILHESKHFYQNIVGVSTHQSFSSISVLSFLQYFLTGPAI